ncbi:v-type ATP synthase subunit E [Striga asiatica]|uniref:V-type ATP synthase subunit E n=1 Tax=Striga asiatica TaxID=4170 RepID=A0A5A7Q4H7_STRAF|nr:v-type ATP synthase subunit E [Striga asiatica]
MKEDSLLQSLASPSSLDQEKKKKTTAVASHSQFMDHPQKEMEVEIITPLDVEPITGEPVKDMGGIIVGSSKSGRLKRQNSPDISPIYPIGGKRSRVHPPDFEQEDKEQIIESAASTRLKQVQEQLGVANLEWHPRDKC